MHQAPSVSVRFQGRAWRKLCCLLVALASGAAGAWALLHLQFSAWPALLAAFLGAALTWIAMPTPVRQLNWDGQTWRLDGNECQLDVMLDLGGCALLRLRLPGGRRQRFGSSEHWALLTAGEIGSTWHGLRVALFAHLAQGVADRGGSSTAGS